LRLVSQYDTCVPDVSIIKRDRLDLKARILDGAPDLAIEVVPRSDTALHLKAKVDAYLANGSHSVWVIYPESKSVIIYRSDSMHEFRANEAIEDPLLPGFSAPVSSFFKLS
jgi:Uma2 family endonuclease